MTFIPCYKSKLKSKSTLWFRAKTFLSTKHRLDSRFIENLPSIGPFVTFWRSLLLESEPRLLSIVHSFLYNTIKGLKWRSGIHPVSVQLRLHVTSIKPVVLLYSWRHWQHIVYVLAKTIHTCRLTIHLYNLSCIVFSCCQASKFKLHSNGQLIVRFGRWLHLVFIFFGLSRVRLVESLTLQPKINW